MDKQITQARHSSPEHLSSEQLFAYLNDALAPDESSFAAKHLLHCAVCRSRMPEPTAEQLFAALFGEDEIKEKIEPQRQKLSITVLSFLSAFRSIFAQPKALAYSTGGVVMVSSLIMFAWLSQANQTAGSRAVADAPAEALSTDFNAKDELPAGASNSTMTTANASDSETFENPAEQIKPQTIRKSNLFAAKSKKLNSASATISGKELARLSNRAQKGNLFDNQSEEVILRGGEHNSETALSFSLIAPVGGSVLEPQPEFRWKKLPGAKDYHISIFDAEFNEVLTVETKETSFRPDKVLQRGEKYLWRVAAQTDAGEVIAPRPPQPPAVFRIAGEKEENCIEKIKKGGAVSFALAKRYYRDEMFDLATMTLRRMLTCNPRDRAARQLVLQIEKRNAADQISVQRCSASSPAPTATKPAQ